MISYRMRFGCLLLCWILCTGLAGCMRADPSIDLAVASQPNVNPDPHGRPSPVWVHFYQLKSDLAFREADFLSLTEKYNQTLAMDVVGMTERTFKPGEAFHDEIDSSPEALFLGIIAGFRQIERAQWRAVLPLNPKKKTPVRMELNDVVIRLVPEEEKKGWTPEKSLEDYEKRMKKMYMNPRDYSPEVQDRY